MEKPRRVLQIEMKVLCEVIAEDGSGDELMSCVGESNVDREDRSAESGPGNNDAKAQAD